MRAISLLVVLALVAGCGAKREEVQRREHRDQGQTKTTAIVERTGTSAGQPYTETVKTVSFTEAVTKGESSAQIIATTTLQAPELEVLGKGAAMVASGAMPGLGGGLSALLGWLTGTPDGAATGFAAASTLALATRKALSDRKRAKHDAMEKDALARDFDLVIKGTSDFMQTHPEQAAALKTVHSKVQDRATKDRIKASRLKQGLV